jgi:hypothetical protein
MIRSNAFNPIWKRGIPARPDHVDRQEFRVAPHQKRKKGVNVPTDTAVHGKSKICGFSRLMADLRARYPASPGTSTRDLAPPVDPAFEHRLERLPPEIGVLLVVIGVAGIMLPGPVGSPFVLAGGLVLWPKGFGRVERWFERRFPRMHREGVSQIDRYLDDLERRFPGSVRENDARTRS